MPTEFTEHLAALDDRELLCAWGRKCIEAAARAAVKKPRVKK